MNFQGRVSGGGSFESSGKMSRPAGVEGQNQAIIVGFRLAFTQVTEDIIEINAAGRKGARIKPSEMGGPRGYPAGAFQAMNIPEDGVREWDWRRNSG